MKKLTVGAAALAAALLAGPAAAQIPHFTPFAFEGRAGLALPTGDLGDAAKNGYSLGGSITYHAFPVVGFYAGASMAKMSAEEDDGDYTDSGFELGARIGIPTPLIPIDPWIKGGVAFHRLELTNTTDDFDDWGTGYEVGAGLGFGFGPLSITPGVTYVSYKVNDGSSATDATVSLVKAELGVRIRL
jgi:opacity protein-like surface antigen